MLLNLKNNNNNSIGFSALILTINSHFDVNNLNFHIQRYRTSQIITKLFYHWVTVTRPGSREISHNTDATLINIINPYDDAPANKTKIILWKYITFYIMPSPDHGALNDLIT